MLKIDSYLGWKVDFAHPAGAEAYCAPDSVSWRVFKNPIALGVGGAAALLSSPIRASARASGTLHL